MQSLTGWGRAGVLPLLCALACASGGARAFEITSIDDAPPSAWIVDFGGYGVVEPIYEGSKRYIPGFKPQIDVWQAGSREWLSFPNDAVGYALYETSDFRAGPAGALTLQSPYHGEDIDLRLGKAEADLAGGAFAEYYPLAYIRTRIDLLQGTTGNTGLAANLSADYIWQFFPDWTLTLGPRMQIANSEYASDYFSTQNAQKTGVYLPFRAEGGVLSSGAELTGKYDLSRQVSTRFFLDYNQLVGDAADNPRVSLRGTSEQFVFG
ncbi:MAG: MipA/OmpV family protein, partial [Rhodomicrobium sp.]